MSASGIALRSKINAAKTKEKIVPFKMKRSKGDVNSGMKYTAAMATNVANRTESILPENGFRLNLIQRKTVPRTDQSGTGANFLVEWISEKPVTEPLVESVMKDLGGNLGLSFLSHGKVIREAQ